MINDFQERKDKILDKIFIGTAEHTKILDKEIKLLKKKKDFIVQNHKEKTSDILDAIEDIVTAHEMQFRESSGDKVSDETISYSLGLRESLRKELHSVLNPNLNKILKAQVRKISKSKKEYKELLKEELKRLSEIRILKKDKRKEVTEIRRNIRKIME